MWTIVYHGNQQLTVEESEHLTRGIAVNRNSVVYLVAMPFNAVWRSHELI